MNADDYSSVSSFGSDHRFVGLKVLSLSLPTQRNVQRGLVTTANYLPQAPTCNHVIALKFVATFIAWKWPSTMISLITLPKISG